MVPQVGPQKLALPGGGSAYLGAGSERPCEVFEHPKVVQEMLGHASITLTMDTYSDVLPGMQEESATRLKALLAER